MRTYRLWGWWMIALWTVGGCTKSLTLRYEASSEDTEDTDSATERDTEAADGTEDTESALPEATPCTTSNLVGAWRIDFPGDDLFPPYFVQYAFSADGSFTENFHSEEETYARPGLWTVDGSELVLATAEDGDTYRTTTTDGATCVLVEDRLYFHAPVLIRVSVDADSLEGAWLFTQSYVSDYVPEVGARKLITDRDRRLFEVTGDMFNFNATEIYEEQVDEEITVHTENHYLSAGGMLRADGDNLYLTYTRVDTDELGDIELGEEVLFGFRVAGDLIFYDEIGRGGPDPESYAYMRVI